MSFTAYFDESGTHEESTAVTMGGFVSTAARWEAFERDWALILEQNEIDFFHMTDFALGFQQFAGWPEEKRRACLKALYDAINKHVIGSVGFGISRAVYNEVVSASANDFMSGPYGLLATICLLDLSTLFRLCSVQGQIAYRFESGAEGIAQVARIFNRHMGKPNSKQFFRLLSFGIEDKRQFLGLQAADILAYELHKQLPKQLGFDDRSPRPFPLPALAQTPHLWGYVNRENLTTFARVAEVGARLDESQFTFEAPREPEHAAVLVPVSEFQQRWRWYQNFMVRGVLPTEQTA